MKTLIVAMLMACAVAHADELITVCSFDSIDAFNIQINTMEKQGWKLYGNLTHGGEDFGLCQMLIKKDKPRPRPKMRKIFAIQCWEPGDARVSDGVNIYLCEGWTLYGQLYMAYDGKEMCQAFTKMVPESDYKCPEEKK